MKSVSPRLAMHAIAGVTVEIAKLRNLRWERRSIRGDYADPFEPDGRWDPIRQYYEGATPYLAFAECGDTVPSICSFLKEYGSSGLECDHISPPLNSAVVSIAQFRWELQQFRFVTSLARHLQKPELLRGCFLDYARCAHVEFQKAHTKGPKQGASGTQENITDWVMLDTRRDRLRWQASLQKLAWALKAPEPSIGTPVALGSPSNDSEMPNVNEAFRKVMATAASHATAQFRALNEHIKALSDTSFVEAAQAYLTKVFMDRFGGLHPIFEFEDGLPRLYVNCRENLLLSFYWMVASDLQGKRLPGFCPICRRFFQTTKADSTYCERRECREIGRKQLSREKHGEKWNQNRRLKRLRLST